MQRSPASIMGEVHIITTKFAKCPSTCTKVEATEPIKCEDAESSGVVCDNPKEIHMGSTTNRGQCEDHRDKGYSERPNES